MPPTGVGARLRRLWGEDIWQASLLNDRSPRGWLYAALRVVSTMATTFKETKTASRAADLSFSSMLGLGPLIAIAMLVASTLFGQRDPNLAVDALNRLISFVAPDLDQYANVDSATSKVPVNPELVQMINGFIKGARSGTAGFVGAVLLIVIVLFLFKSIEDAFNDIWGVRRGRTLLMRLVFYWTTLTLGGVVFFAAAALLGAGAFVNVFVGKFPFGAELIGLLRWSLPSFSFVVLVGVLAVFYRAIPNTRVRWGAAFAGALAVALLLTANNFLQFLYLERVLLTRSLFGSLGIIPVLMFGLYIFWLFVLIGGQISYAVQNVHVRNSRLAWGRLSAANRERLSLGVLMAICRRFHGGLPPITGAELSSAMRLPDQIVNECLNRIVDAGYVMAVPAQPGSRSTEVHYQPTRPLNRINLLEFKLAAEELGSAPAGDSMGALDPIVDEFERAVGQVGRDGFLGRSVDELLSGESSAK
jgi:membrane protein